DCLPSVIVQLKGNPLIMGVRYELSCLRCTLCGKYYVAPLPEEAKGREKYDETCRSSIALARYYAGFPFYRIQRMQALQHIPLADSTQWDLMLQLYAMVFPVYQALEQCAAQGELFHYDDTGNRIIELKKKSQAAHTTAFISMWENHAIYLFYTSQAIGGKNLALLLENRSTEEPFFTMADASSHNIPKVMDENLIARWILCFCLVHGRRKFYEIQHLYSKECELVLDIISQVYQNEAYCKKNKGDPPARLTHHQQYSGPLMEALKTWLNNQLLHRCHEPNSAFGQAVAYMLRHWQPLTRFLEVAGAPIDNSLCEQAIKVAIRHRRNSLFYKTQRGAQVGDCLMSLIHTAAKNQVNFFDYLNALQLNAHAVKADPSQWLPWNYRQTLQQLHAPPVIKAA
ncbi:MAG: IS66 family transposase, partial [Gammaproteobacteria bacterium]|nr:IS66 family transposase [Gammaproteobacteria bacterium]